MHGVGRTSGEGIESNWEISNPAALSTREMSTAARHETLNDIFGAINWAKTMKIGTLNDIDQFIIAYVDFPGPHLGKLLTEAIDELTTQQAMHKELEETIPAAYIAKWDRMVSAYEHDSSQPDPFTEKANGTFQPHTMIIQSHHSRSAVTSLADV